MKRSRLPPWGGGEEEYWRRRRRQRFRSSFYLPLSSFDGWRTSIKELSWYLPGTASSRQRPGRPRNQERDARENQASPRWIHVPRWFTAFPLSALTKHQNGNSWHSFCYRLAYGLKEFSLCVCVCLTTVYTRCVCEFTTNFLAFLFLHWTRHPVVTELHGPECTALSS